MQDIYSNIVVIMVLAVLGGGIYIFFRNKEIAARRKLDQMAREHGWKLENLSEQLAWGVRITDGEWTLESISRSSSAEAAPGSSNVSMSTCWQADRPGSTLLLGPRLPGAVAAPTFAGQFVRMVTGESLTEVTLSNPILQEKYMAWAQDPVEAATRFMPTLEASLLAWQGTPPLIKRDPSGLTMEITRERLKSPERILAFIQIGEALLHATE
jgi:hypothetical protein